MSMPVAAQTAPSRLGVKVKSVVILPFTTPDLCARRGSG